MIRLLATFVLALGLVLMPLAMTGGPAMAAQTGGVAAVACPDHQPPAGHQAPAHKGQLHCLMCAALPQPAELAVPTVPVIAAAPVRSVVPQLLGVAPEVTDPPPKTA